MLAGVLRRRRVAQPVDDLGPRPRAFAWLTGALTLVVLPHAARMPAWVIVVAILFVVWRALHDHFARPLPGRILRLGMAVTIFSSVVLSFGVPTGRNAGIALLIALLGLKLLETRGRRDVMVLGFLGYFLVITNFLYSQSIPMMFYMLLVVFCITLSLMHFLHIDDVDAARLQFNIRRSAVILVQSLPVMLVLFLFFPRVSGPLWGLPSDAHSGLTGLSDRMSPGRISQLGTSTAVAFRVRFEGDVPPAEQRYWRGPVFWDFDGYSWSAGTPLAPQPLRVHIRAPAYTYTLTLEPHGRRWIFALDLPVAVIRNGVRHSLDDIETVRTLGAFTSDFQIQAQDVVTDRLRYTLISHTNYHTDRLTDEQWARGLRLPDNISARVLDLARRWRRTSATDADIVNTALRYFREQPFVYTLSPPLLGPDPVGEFLFDSRQGYCEHYASAFTILMRAAGIPSRVVTGYQGGRLNPLGGYMIVRQLDAHAWSEVWLDESGWVRVDPTSAVAPERIRLGLDAMLRFSTTPAIILENARLASLWQRARMTWDATNNLWNQWVLNYDPVRQSHFMAQLGLGAATWRGMITVLVILLCGILLVIALPMLHGRPAHDPASRLYYRFCRKLARRGIVRRPCEGPLDYTRRVARLRPDLAEPVIRIGSLYIGLRYARRPPPRALRLLRHRVRSFRP